MKKLLLSCAAAFLLGAFIAALSAAENPVIRAAALKKQYDSQCLANAMSFLDIINYDEVPEPKLGNDPRASDVLRMQEAVGLNSWLRNMKRFHDGAKPGAKQDQECVTAVLSWYRCTTEADPLWPMLAKYKSISLVWPPKPSAAVAVK